MSKLYFSDFELTQEGCCMKFCCKSSETSLLDTLLKSKTYVEMRKFWGMRIENEFKSVDNANLGNQEKSHE